ncbi:MULTISPECIES: membrane lipoprotein lipid attachment site-containing protein [unclassified Staphylococcus]|uniref:membrane lipoprotein lipid attachment site-containing protein n=1 Tax=unclassified Staphylococcus TaxID=91994 RepID=UPI0021D34348|nr:MULTISPECIES: membrane lipoprotein lipid attachment site-containing protein [unclassified Staphylococcus]UXR74057.1 membrane lipoprotein lipid attachment site-containing protein [Staphylococcus sp. IVB6238]UXR76448.1 membrane lipoprotein lipid attachment site-containing protein [Staphylococcus sp. IVB6233]UXR80575.1 membrane lipoprotein lipid attachment site-containing protein [Staphylococcus sp. IVB6218]
MKKILLGAIVSAFLLTGCSNVTNSKELKMGEVFNSGKEHVSYLIDYSSDYTEDVDKDSYVDYVIISKKGETKFYYMEDSDITLGEVTKMSNDEVKEKALELYKNNFNENKNDELSNLKTSIEDHYGVYDRSEKQKFKKRYNELKNKQYLEPEFEKMNLKVVTDGSGNETKYEKFTFKRQWSGGEYTLPVSVPIYPFDIYDKKYAGVKSKKENAYLITEVGDKVEEVVLDSKDDKYVDEVD